MKFVSGLGFSNGWALLVLKGPPPFVPKILIGFLRRERPLRNHLIGDRLRCCLAVSTGGLYGLRVQQLCCVVGPQVLDHALRHKHHRDYQACGKQNPQHRPRDIHPEVADGFGFFPRDATDHGDGKSNANARRRKIVVGKAGHLREIAHGRFAAVVLPVRVRGERSGGIERQRGRNGSEVLRIPGQPLLHALDQIEDQHRHAR